ncbi:MAG: hypothetical protein R3C62_19040 [Chloroflexota bacterium]
MRDFLGENGRFLAEEQGGETAVFTYVCPYLCGEENGRFCTQKDTGNGR